LSFSSLHAGAEGKNDRLNSILTLFDLGFNKKRKNTLFNVALRGDVWFETRVMVAY
jgi:hypothetical protein